MKTLRQRFEEKYIPEPNSGCWLWTAGCTDGYGQIWVGSRAEGTGRMAYAHCISYEFYVGPIPEGLELDHKCRVRSCVNPDHLEPVTTRENILRGMGATARHARQTHCKAGHSLSRDNLGAYGLKHGFRRCMKCDRHRRAAAMARL
jgi:hypothetical protein